MSVCKLNFYLQSQGLLYPLETFILKSSFKSDFFLILKSSFKSDWFSPKVLSSNTLEMGYL